MKKIILLVLVVLLVAGCGNKAVLQSNQGELKINIEIADDEKERATGLMNREFLDEFSGMLFIFEKPARYSFWMKNTLIPLDMIFIDENRTIVTIHKMVPPCEADPCPGYKPDEKALYVLEVNGGFTDKYAVEEGTKVKI